MIGSRGFLGHALTLALRRLGVQVEEFNRNRPALDERHQPRRGLVEADVVFHMASSVNPKIAEEHPELVARDRTLFERLLDGLVGAHDAVTVVLPSSGGTVYDPKLPPPYSEVSPVSRNNAYAASRLEFEEMLRTAGGSVRPAICRISNAYGPGQRVGTGQGVIGHWLHAALAHEPVRLFGDPLTRRDYIYVDDAVEALVLVGLSHDIESEANGAMINLGSGVPTSLRELADRLIELVNRESVTLVMEKARPFDRHDTWLDVKLAERVLGWRASVPLDEGLRRTWQLLTQRRDGSGQSFGAVERDVAAAKNRS